MKLPATGKTRDEVMAVLRQSMVEDLAWVYRTPVQESVRIAGLACFYNEKVDLCVDGVLEERPHTKFS